MEEGSKKNGDNTYLGDPIFKQKNLGGEGETYRKGNHSKKGNTTPYFNPKVIDS